MQELLDSAPELLTPDRLLSVARAVVALLLGLLLARLAGRGVQALIARRGLPQQAALGRRLTGYAVFALTVMVALRQLGFELGALLGAAGILTVAVGFAAQTSASNIISGLFLMSERSFGVGDVIRVGTTLGEVVSIDLLSVKLRTFDNLLVRLPNEMLAKSEITTLSHFPIRRVDLKLGCAYHQDLERMQKVLLDVADKNPLVLEEPKPLFIVSGFGPDGVDVLFAAWTKSENFLEMRNTLVRDIKQAFDEVGIEFPFPQRTVHLRGELPEVAATTMRAREKEPAR